MPHVTGNVMDRREFIKACSIMAAASLLFGCRKVPLADETASVTEPELNLFREEVRLAMSQMRTSLDLVRVQTPGALRLPGSSHENRFGMAIDLDACDGCGKCILACNLENNVPLVTAEESAKGRFMHWIEMRGATPFMCAHCENAPCEKVCPTGAANHTPDGISAMMYKRCAGSRFCGANCPLHARKFNYNDAKQLGLARQFNDEVPLRHKGVMEKCSLCLHRLQNDRARFKTLQAALPEKEREAWRGQNVKTACSEACPKNAIVFGNWLDEKSPLVMATRGRQLYAPRELASLKPSIVYMMGKR